MKITFFGAAKGVTGSCSLVEVGGSKVLIDCGMFQGSKEEEKRNFEALKFDPKELDAVIVTHAHLDHVGRLPLLIKGGYGGFFYATSVTAELARLIMEDAFAIMRENNRKFGTPMLYDYTDIAGVADSFKPLEYGEEYNLNEGKAGEKILVKLYDAGHIFGSSFVEIFADGKRVVFSGDIGNENAPIVRDTEMLPANLDAVICESTYGNRLHESLGERNTILQTTISKALKRGGTLMIPSFALERTQELIYMLNDLIDRKNLLPRVPIFLDSPLALNATKVYRKYPEYYDEEATKLINSDDDLFDFPGLTLCESREESKRINQVFGSKIIIAGSGMMNGGRIVHHALRYLSDERNTLLIVGYQAYGTLGRELLDGVQSVNILGEKVRVKCEITAIGAMSAHGDQEKLLGWIGGGKSMPKQILLNHGEPAASAGLEVRLKEDFGAKVTVVDVGLKVKV